jgi:hypothetical protein
MADGNVGDLMMSLGLKETITKDLDKIQKKFNGTDEVAKKVQAAIEGIRQALKDSSSASGLTTALKNLQTVLESSGQSAKAVSSSLKAIRGAEALEKVGRAAGEANGEVNKMLNTLLGGKAAGMSLEEIAKKAARYSAELASVETTMRKKVREATSGGEQLKGDPTRSTREAIRNAQTYLDLVQRIYLKQKEISETGSKQPNIDTSKLKQAKTLLDEFGLTLSKIVREGKGVDGSLVMGNLPKALQSTMREVKDILSSFSKENPLSVFANNADRAWTAISNLETKVRDLKSLMDEGMLKGFKTDMLPENIFALESRLKELYRLFGDSSRRLTDKAYMGNLFSDISKTEAIARSAQRDYGREKGITLAATRSVEREMASELSATQKAREQDLRDMAAYAKRYMELQEAKRRSDEKTARDSERRSEAERRRIASDTTRMSRLYASLELGIGRGERVGMQGLGLGVDVSALDKALREATELKAQIEGANVALMGKGGRASYEWYAAQADRLKASLTTATEAQRELNAARDKANKRAESDRKSKEAKDAREAVAAERQRQREIEKTEARMESLSRVMDKMKEARLGSVGRGADTREIDRQIARAEQLLTILRDMNASLYTSDWRNNLGRVGNIGNGRDVREYADTARAQREVNAQIDRNNEKKEKSIALERKHQAEIAQTAAKVRNDLAKAFEQAKRQASGMSSVVQDLKSLFMQGGIVYGAQQFVMSVIQTGGELEKQHIALQSILGDMQNANQMFNQVKGLALNSPFTFSELNRDVKQLAAYGVEYENLYDTTKRLADMASGLGVSFERIALAFGQVQARGWLDGKELRQIAYAGIPLLDKLSDYYSKREGRKVTTSEVKTRISGRGVDFEDVKNIFWEMTDAGGQFYNMQQVLSETLLGKYNKLKDAWEIMLSEFASGNNLMGKGLKRIIELVTWLVQSLHSLAPVVAAAFAGPMLGRLGRSLSGGLEKNLLSAKNSMATEYQRKALEGKKLNGVEREILKTRNMITAEDVKTLAKARAITQVELQRLYVSGRITKEMYAQNMALLRQQGQTTSLSFKERMRQGMSGWFNGGGAKWGALVGLVANGLKTGLSSILGFFGGLPGIAISAGAAIFAYYQQKNAELKQAMEQTAAELQDRAKQMGEFLRDNDVSKTIAEGDDKAIDNMIDSYKEKLKEISPQSASAFAMHAEEIASHKERLRYLEIQLKLLMKANALAKEMAGDSDSYEKLSENTEKAVEAAKKLAEKSANLRKPNPTGNEQGEYDDAKADFDKYIENLAAYYKREIPDILTSDVAREAFNANLASMLSQAQGITEEAAMQIRSGISQSLGLEDNDLEREFAKKYMSMIDNAFPEIANRIRAHKELDAESRKKVEKLMQGAVSQLSVEYPHWESALQRLLRESNFEARIHLVFSTGVVDEMDAFKKRVYDNFTAPEAGLFSQLDPLLKGVSDMYTAQQNVEAELKKRENLWKREEQLKGKRQGNEVERKRLKKSFEDLRDAAWKGLGYKYVSEDKKTNRTPKGEKRDLGLETLKRQLKDFKAARQAYQKLRKEVGMSKGKAKNEVYGLYKDLDWKLIDLDDYTGSLSRLKKGFNFDASNDRKAFRTELAKEDFEWKLSEVLKPEFARVSANFKEALEKGARQADLWQELYEKTGDKGFADLALKDGALWNDYTRGLSDDFKKRYGQPVDLSMTDADAQKHFEGVMGAYEMWQKIVSLVKGDYTKFLTDAATIIEKTSTTEEKLAAIDSRYEKPIKDATESGNTSLATRYRQTRDAEKEKVRFDAYKSSEAYLSFYGAIEELGKDKAGVIANEIRNKLNQALADGSLDAREYTKEIKTLQEQLDKLSQGKKTFFLNGALGVADRKIAEGDSKFNLGSYKRAEGEKKQREGEIANDQKKIEEGKKLQEAGEALQKAGKELQDGGKKIKEGWEKAVKVADKVDNVIQGIVGAFNDVKDTFGALGFDTESDSWQDASAVMNSLSGMSSGVKSIINGAATGDIGGVIQGGVSLITSPIKAFAAAHDAKQDRQIKHAERNITEFERMREYVNKLLDATLGGVYEWKMDASTSKTLNSVVKSYREGLLGNNFIGKVLKSSTGKASLSQYSKETYEAARSSLNDPTNAYKAQRASLLAQRDELQRQRDAESKKKKKDKDKLADYDNELREMSLTIKQFSTDFLKSVYGVDMKSWASQLTDSVVSAWEKGEDAIDAYKKKAKELVKDLTKNILSQKVMKTALSKPLDYLTGLIEQKGKLDESDMPKLIDQLVSAGEDASYNITAILDALKAKGYDFSESGSGSVSSSISTLTEGTGDLLASYLNAIRLDVSVTRGNVQLISDLLREQMPEMGQIQKAQLGQLTQLVVLAESRNAKLDKMIDWMGAVTTGGRKKIYVN